MIPVNYPAIIFDLDGTLAYTLDDIAGSMNRILASHGYTELHVEDYRLLVGRGLDNLVKTALPEHARHPEIVNTCLHQMINDYDKNCLVTTRLYEGINEVLHQLQISGVKMAVFSNKAEHLTIKIVKTLLQDINFISITGARPDLPRKPDPSGAWQICKLMNVSPGETVYVGDSDVDMITGIRAGMYPVGVAWGFRSREELLYNGAAVIVDNPFQILELKIKRG